MITCSPKIKTALELANQDYEAFWESLSEEEQNLTKDLMCSDSCDTIFIDGDDLYLLTETANGFTTEFVGHKSSDLVVYADLETTGLDNENQLTEFIEKLQHELPSISVVSGQSSSGRTGAEWLTNSYGVEKAWGVSIADV